MYGLCLHASLPSSALQMYKPPLMFPFWNDKEWNKDQDINYVREV